MNSLSPIAPTEQLPALIDAAASALLSAKTSAEVLEARDMASVAYDAAKKAGRMARAKEAHDTLLAEVYRAQAKALAIEARAKIRLADEYDAAQDRGEVRANGERGKAVGDCNSFWDRKQSATDLGLRRDQIHEARQIRDAEREQPGLTQRALDAMVERGEEPTKAALRRELAPKPKAQMGQKPLWVWGRIKDFHRDGYMQGGAASLLEQMTPQMRADIRQMAPFVAEFIAELGDEA